MINCSCILYVLQYTRTVNHSKNICYVPKDSWTCDCFVWVDSVKKPLQNHYDGPYQVLDKNSKYFKLRINQKETM